MQNGPSMMNMGSRNDPRQGGTGFGGNGPFNGNGPHHGMGGGMGRGLLGGWFGMNPMMLNNRLQSPYFGQGWGQRLGDMMRQGPQPPMMPQPQQPPLMGQPAQSGMIAPQNPYAR